MKSWNYSFVIFLLLVVFSSICIIFYFYLSNLNKKLLNLELLVNNQIQYENILEENLVFKNQINKYLDNIKNLEEEKLINSNNIFELQKKIVSLNNEISVFKNQTKTEEKKEVSKVKNTLIDENLVLKEKIVDLENNLQSILNKEKELQIEVKNLRLKVKDFEKIKKDYNKLLTFEIKNNEKTVELKKKNSDNFNKLKNELEVIKSDKKKTLENYESQIFDLNKELIYFKNYKNNLERLNGLQVIFSGSMRYDVELDQIVFKNNDYVDIQMIQDDFSGKLVGECGLPINIDTKKRCSVTIMAEIIFNEKGLFLKGKEIVDILN